MMRDFSPKFRERLLARTLDYVVDRVPFYQRMRGALTPSSVLDDFPIIDKARMNNDLDEFLVLDRFPDYVVTSGGTSGAPSITFRVQEEYAATLDYFSGVPPDRIPEPESLREFTIDLFFNSNGYSFRKPPGWPIISVTLEQRYHAELVRKLIRDGVTVAGRTIPARHLQSQNGPIRTLTGYFWVADFQPRKYELLSLVVYGAHITRVWRKRLLELWGTDAKTTYGLSEIGPGSATQCEHCDSYHYWTVWPEFLALDRSGPVEAGDAWLVLTTLVPFTQAQPRIRFMTEDIVTITGYCAAAEQLGFRFRGRASSSIICDSNVLLSEIEVLETIDRLPDIACRPHSSERQIWGESDLAMPPFAMGFPRYTIANGDNPSVICVRIETTYDCLAERRRAGLHKEQFFEILHEEFPDLRRRLEAYGKTLSVDLVPAGSLKTRIKASA